VKRQGEQDNSMSETFGGTVENFASRIRRKLKEQEVQQGESSRLATERQGRILHAMTSVRKALHKASKISLGGRFKFALDMSDWEGWPKLELRLVDTLAPDLSSIALVASASDRNELGAVVLHLRSGEVLGRVHLNDLAELAKLPLLLKKCLRQYLDTVAHQVLNPSRVEESLEVQTAPLEIAFEEETAAHLSDQDVFVEDEINFGTDNQVEVAAEAPGILPLSLAIKT
jgi:hypothetical protein